MNTRLGMRERLLTGDVEVHPDTSGSQWMSLSLQASTWVHNVFPAIL